MTARELQRYETFVFGLALGTLVLGGDGFAVIVAYTTVALGLVTWWVAMDRE